MAIPIVVSHRHAEAPASQAKPEPGRRIDEFQPTEILEHPAARPLLGSFEGGPVGSENIEIAVRIKIDERQPTPLHLENLPGGNAARGQRQVEPR